MGGCTLTGAGSFRERERNHRASLRADIHAREVVAIDEAREGCVGSGNDTVPSASRRTAAPSSRPCGAALSGTGIGGSRCSAGCLTPA